MRHDQNFSRYFKILGIEPNSDWQQVRKAYRHKARIWHPDRLPDIDNIRAQAEEKFKDVNNAFHTLSAYRRRHGRLPNIQPQQTHNNNNKTKPHSRTTPKSNTRTRAQTPAKQWLARPLNRHILMSAALLMIAYGLWWPSIPTETSVPAPETNGSAEIQQKQTRLINYGSSISDVYEIQGTPTRTVGSVWLYGSSQILFENGIVVGWEENADTPLKTQDANPAETFQISR